MMKKAKFTVLLSAVGVSGLVLGFCFQIWLRNRNLSAVGRYEYSAMGTDVSFTVNTARFRMIPDASDAVSSIIASGVAAVGSVESELSVFRDTSLVSKINAASGSGEFFPLTPGTHEVFMLSESVGEASGWTLDPTVGPYMRLWGFRGGKNPEIPPDSVAIADAGKLCGWTNVVEIRGSSVRLRAAGASLDFGAVAKGSGADAAFREMMRHGCRNFMVNIGGNVRCIGVPERGGDGWKIAVRNPFYPQGESSLGVLTLTDGRAVATSGQYERYVVIGGVKYAHIMNPVTGRPVEYGKPVQVTVVAATAGLADALSTALFVAGPDAGIEIVKKFTGAEAMFVSGTKESPVIRATPGFGAYYRAE